VILSTGDGWVGRIRPIVADVAQLAAPLGLAVTRLLDALSQVPQITYVIHEQVSGLVVSVVRLLGGARVLAGAALLSLHARLGRLVLTGS